MASDLCRDTRKDRDELTKTNSRLRASSGLTSSDFEYKNYLAAVRPRVKTVNSNEGKVDESVNRPRSSSFVDSAVRSQSIFHQHRAAKSTNNPIQKLDTINSNFREMPNDNDTETNKTHRASYSEFSSVPNKKSKPTFKTRDERKRSSSLKSQSEIDFSSLKHVQSDSGGSVGKLRSMFDKTVSSTTKPVVQMRTHPKRTPRPMSAGFVTSAEKKFRISGIYEKQSVRETPKTLNIDNMLCEQDSLSTTEEKVQHVIPSSPTKVMQNILNRKNSEYDNFEDRIVPTGNKKIDVSSMLAAEEKHETVTSNSSDNDEVTAKDIQLNLQKDLEIDRLKRTQEEVEIEKRFNLKRRSLKERLSDCLTSDDKLPLTNSSYTVADPMVNNENHIIEDSIKHKTKSDNFDTHSTTKVVPEIKSKSAKKADYDEVNLNAYKSSDINTSTEVHNSTELKAEPLKVSLDNDIHDSKTCEGEGDTDTSKPFEITETANFKSYKSAVERFDEFISTEVEPIPDMDMSPVVNVRNIQLTIEEPLDPKPLKRTSNENVEVDSKMDYNQNILMLKGDLPNSSSTDHSRSEDVDLMNSILNHMEKSSKEDINDQCITLLRSPTSPDEIRFPISPDEIRFPTSSDDIEIKRPLIQEGAPEILPRLSKQQATATPPVSEDEAISPSSENITESVPDEVGYSSHTTGCESDSACESNDEITLPPPPSKSNLKNALHRDPNKRVNFKTKNLHKVIFTYGPAEYNRANPDIDPIASSAEWELEKRVDNMDIFSVDLQKDERGLGLSIIGLGVGTESGVEKLGIFVKTLTEKGAAQKDGRIQVNDQILEVNGVSLVGVTQFFAAQTLKGTNGVVRFLMGREKSRRTYYAPGAAMADNPDMQKHIEEMNTVLQQLEDAEECYIQSEKILEDVKIELLQAEDRAHDAESQLQDTKEQLKAVTESPFISGQRKMKNEIKNKKGAKNEKNGLQRNLIEMTNRLSMSEENLLELSNINNEKDIEIHDLKTKVEESCNLNKVLEESNKTALQNLNKKDEEIVSLKNKLEEIEKTLHDLQNQFDEEKKSLIEKEKEQIKTFEAKEEEYKSKHKQFDSLNENLQQEIQLLNVKLQASQTIVEEVENYRQQLATLAPLKQEMSAIKIELENANLLSSKRASEVNTLTEKNEYLQSLITKLDRSQSESNAEEEREKYMDEKKKLREKIAELEKQLYGSKQKFFDDITVNDFTASVSVEQDISSSIYSVLPELPKREYINVNTQQQIKEPPSVSRINKPNSASHQDITVELSLGENESVVEEVSSVTLAENVESVPNLSLEPSEPAVILNTSTPSLLLDETTSNLVLETSAPNLSLEETTLNLLSEESAPNLLEETTPNLSLEESPHKLSLDLEVQDKISVVDEVNPIPKPERGHFNPATEKDDSVFVQKDVSADIASVALISPVEKPVVEAEANIVVQQAVETESSSEVSPFAAKPSLAIDIVSQSPIFSEDNNLIDKEVVLETSSLIQSVSDSIIISAVAEASSPEKGNITLEASLNTNKESADINQMDFFNLAPPPIDLDSLPEDNVDNDSDDEGKFQIISEEYQEEQSTPNSAIRHTEGVLLREKMSLDSKVDRSSLFQSIANEPSTLWLDEEFKRLDSKAREERADEIAAQVAEQSPVKRKMSNASSSSSEDETNRSPNDDSLNRGQSIKIDSSYFEQSTKGESFDHEVSILDDDNLADTKTEVVKSSSFDSAILSTPVLDSKYSLDKCQLVKNGEKRQPPSQGICDTLAASNDELQLNNLLHHQTTTTTSASTPDLAVALSVPTLTSTSVSASSIDKPDKLEKSKHKFGFHLPKVFKKTKLRKQKSKETISLPSPNTDAPIVNVEGSIKMQKPLEEENEESIPVIPNELIQPSPLVRTDTDVVPIDEKADEINLEKVNDVATEEAVVPFADKEMLMASNGIVEDTNKEKTVEVSTQELSESSTPMLSATIEHKDISAASPDDIDIDIDTSPSAGIVPLVSTSTSASNYPQINERAIDVPNIENGHMEEGNISHWTRRPPGEWDVTQVGLWLVQMSLAQYVNSFKSNNVDGRSLIRIDGNKLKEYGVHNSEHRVEIKKHLKEFRNKLGKDSFNKGKHRDHKSTKDRLQFWKGKYKVIN